LTEDRAFALDVLARTLWGEARGEGETGQKAVAAVICTRVMRGARYQAKWGTPHPLFGDGTFKQACLRPRQFSCWNAGDPNLPKMKALNLTDPALAGLLRIAEDAVDGRIIDPTGGATHYLTKAAYDKVAADHWCRTKPSIWQHGNHLFFKDP